MNEDKTEERETLEKRLFEAQMGLAGIDEHYRMLGSMNERKFVEMAIKKDRWKALAIVLAVCCLVFAFGRFK
jgi:hypothetical protein